MITGPEEPARKSLSRVTLGLALLGALFAVGLCSFVFVMLRPRGEKVGDSNLTDPEAVLVVNGSPGDSLVFRVDVAIGQPLVSLRGDDQLDEQASAQLRKSILTVRAAAPSGAERSATCALSNGRSAMTSSTPGRFFRSGMRNDCSLVLDQPGPWQVRAAVAWASDIKLHSASLETRLATP